MPWTAAAGCSGVDRRGSKTPTLTSPRLGQRRGRLRSSGASGGAARRGAHDPETLFSARARQSLREGALCQDELLEAEVSDGDAVGLESGHRDEVAGSGVEVGQAVKGAIVCGMGGRTTPNSRSSAAEDVTLADVRRSGERRGRAGHQ